MMTHDTFYFGPRSLGVKSQRGISVVVALMMLSAILLAAVGLIRSADSAGLISGNYAFQKDAIGSTEEAIFAAMRTFSTAGISGGSVGGVPQDQANVPPWYFASTQTSTGGTNAPYGIPDALAGAVPVVGGPIVVGHPARPNTAYFMVERLCPNAGEIQSNCALGAMVASGQQASGAPLKFVAQTLYRITVRVDGGRGAQAFAQVVVPGKGKQVSIDR